MTWQPPMWQPWQWQWGRGGGRRRRNQPVPPPPAIPALEITVPASSFIPGAGTYDVRAARDGAVGGTAAGSFVAISGVGAVPDRAFWFSQADPFGAQQGLAPVNWIPELAGYAMVQVELVTGIVLAVDVATALEAEIAAFGDYAVTRTGTTVRVEGQIDSAGSFTGAGFSSRGTSGQWGMQVEFMADQGVYGSGAVTTCVSQRAIAPALNDMRVVAMDVFVGNGHDAGDQFRLALYSGGTGVNPVGATLVYDFGQIQGTDIATWVRLFVAPQDIVTIANAAELWLTCKGNGGLTEIGFFPTASGLDGDFEIQNFWNSSGMSADPAIAYEGVYVAGGDAFTALILGMRLVYQTPPFLGDASWLRRFGVHVPVTDATSETDIDSQVMMGNTFYPIGGVELDYIEIPFGTVHPVDNQFRACVYQGGINENPDNAVLLYDFGETPGTATQAFVRLNAPPSGPTAVAIDPVDDLWWVIKNDDAATGPRLRFALNANQETVDPPENPFDWFRSAGPGTGPEYEAFNTNPVVNTDPSVPFVGVFQTDPSDTAPGNQPAAALGLRINGIVLVAF